MNLRRISGFAALFFLLASVSSLKAVLITNVSPPLSARGLHLIDIYGNGFAPNNQHPAKFSVDFNGVVSSVNPLSVVSDSHIQVTNVPALATSGRIHVSINGVSNTSPQVFIIISTNAYVTNFTPTYGSVDSPVTITGVQFLSGNLTNVSFNGAMAKSFFRNSDNLISATVPTNAHTGPIILLYSSGTNHNFSTVSNQISSATNFFAQPMFVSFAPTNGRPGTNVVLTGTNFTGISGISFGDVAATDFTISNNTSIRVTVPANASTGVINVSPPAGTIFPPASSSLTFRILPNIFNFSPTSGSPNTSVTLTGSGLNEQSPAPLVFVGDGLVTSFASVSPDTLMFNVPPNATSGPITVTTTNGSATSSQIFYLPDSITSFTPTSGPAGTIVTITGKNFTNASAVNFNGIPATAFVVTNNTTIGAIAPIGVTSGLITITTPFGTTNSAGLFFVAPTITDFTPTHGVPGTRVTIIGTSFTNASAVAFNGTPAASFVVTNNTTLSAVVPAGASTGKISVTGPGGTGVSVIDFIFDSTDVAILGTDSPDPVFIGSNLVYVITITNAGLVTAFNVQFTDVLPPSVIFESAAVSQGTLDTNAAPITGSLGNLGIQSAATILLTVKPTAIGLITNIVSVATDSLDPNPSNNNLGMVTTVWPLPFLSITNLMSNNLVQIKWPAALSNFTLQSRTDLSTNTWTNDTAPKVLIGTNVTVIDTNVGTPKFFRLTN
jgi:uncharacterized repeat protein (TIGR01451 family)